MAGGKRNEGKGVKGGKGGKASGKEPGSKGGSKGKDGGKGKGGWSPLEPAAKTVQELEAEILLARRDEAPDRRRRSAADRQPLEFQGDHCNVKKHSEMGCAVVVMESAVARDAVMRLTTDRTPEPFDGSEKRPDVTIEGTKVQLRAHVDKSDHTEIKTDIFIAWGRKVEKEANLPPEAIAHAFDDLFRESPTLILQDTAAATAAIKSMLAARPQTLAPRAPPPPPQVPPQPPAGMPGSPAPPAAFFGFPGQVLPAVQPDPAAQMAAQQYMMVQAQQMAQAQQMMAQQAAWHSQQAAAAQQAAATQQAAAAQQAFMQQAAMQQATMQQAAVQQAAAAQQQQPHPALPPQDAAAPDGGSAPATPPRPGHSLRADAPSFDFTPEPPDHGESRRQFQILDPVTKEPAEMPGYGEPRKQFQILDPSTKQPMEARSLLFEPPKKVDRKAMAIIDPDSGDVIRALDFSLPKKDKSFTITDPNSGTAIKV